VKFSAVFLRCANEAWQIHLLLCSFNSTLWKYSFNFHDPFIGFLDTKWNLNKKYFAINLWQVAVWLETVCVKMRCNNRLAKEYSKQAVTTFYIQVSNYHLYGTGTTESVAVQSTEQPLSHASSFGGEFSTNKSYSRPLIVTDTRGMSSACSRLGQCGRYCSISRM